MSNVHMEHLEDTVLNDGISGVLNCISLIKNIFDNYINNNSTGVRLSIKFDGCPALLTGINPENGKFFVGTKSVLSKNIPKICYTYNDVVQHYGNTNKSYGLFNILSNAIYDFKHLGITSILQGDLMYCNDQPTKIEQINDIRHITCQPNNICYAVPEGHSLFGSAASFPTGIAFHTEYIGSTMQMLQHSFDPDLSKLNSDARVCLFDAKIPEVKILPIVNNYIENKLDSISTELSYIDRSLLDVLFEVKAFPNLIKRFENSMIRRGVWISEVNIWYEYFLNFIEQDIHQDKVLTSNGKSIKIKRLVAKANKLKTVLLHVFVIQKEYVKIKNALLLSLEQNKEINTYYNINNTLQPTGHEGYVLIDNTTNNAIKLVDRLNFSRMNFLNRI